MANYYTLKVSRTIDPDPQALLGALREIEPTIGVRHSTGDAAFVLKSNVPLSDDQLASAERAIAAAPEPSDKLNAKRALESLPPAQVAVIAALLDEINVIRAAVALSPITTEVVLQAAGDHAETIAEVASLDVIENK